MNVLGKDAPVESVTGRQPDGGLPVGAEEVGDGEAKTLGKDADDLHLRDAHDDRLADHSRVGAEVVLPEVEGEHRHPGGSWSVVSLFEETAEVRLHLEQLEEVGG